MKRTQWIGVSNFRGKTIRIKARIIHGSRSSSHAYTSIEYQVIKKKGYNNLTVEDLVKEITPVGRQTVPDVVKKELLVKIQELFRFFFFRLKVFFILFCRYCLIWFFYPNGIEVIYLTAIDFLYFFCLKVGMGRILGLLY